ncbi:MAG: hypothetical protein AAFP90_04030, partial [Planctomycetota bacterium]
TGNEIFPGLWMDLPSLPRGDAARSMAVIQDGRRSEGHAEFVKRLGIGQWTSWTPAPLAHA